MKSHDWYPRRDLIRYRVAAIVYHDFGGIGFRFARKDGKILKFWSFRKAQAFADRLNRGEGFSK